MEQKVFLVEDFPHMRSWIEELCAPMEHVQLVGMAATEAEAKDWLDAHGDGWNVLIIDLVLDQGSGMEVIRHARRSGGTGKIVVFSSFASPAVREHCLKIGADAVYDKGQGYAFISWLCERGAEGGSLSAFPGEL